jgi:hypothetical protein
VNAATTGNIGTNLSDQADKANKEIDSKSPVSKNVNPNKPS